MTRPLLVLPLLLLSACGVGQAQLTDELLDDADFALGQAHVELLYVKAASRFPYQGSEGLGRMYGFVAVKNLAYEKDVAVHWGQRQGAGPWRDTAATYVGALADGREVWTFETPEVSYPPRLSAEFQFAVRYRVQGREYWDNRGGSDWRIATGARTVFPADVVLGASPCALRKANAWQHGGAASLQGIVVVKNLAYDKRLRVVYSTDGWRTLQTGAATYGHPLSDGTEEWYFDVPLAPGATHVDFALSCEMNGVTTWDNHFGRDYTAAVPGSVE